ncbi:retrovirus-related pol polyprotein from transposon TNT 1-94 [Tanacetum coccineum]
MKASMQGKTRIKKVKMYNLSITRGDPVSEADCTLDFRALDFQITQLTEKIMRAKHIDQTAALLTKNENLKAQIHENLKCITMDSVKPRVLAIGVNSCTDASGSQPRSHTKKNRIFPAKNVNQKKVEEHHRTNKASLKTTNRINSSISSNRIVGTDRPLVFGIQIGTMTSLVAIMGYGDYVIGDSVISRHSCYVHDTDGVELIKGSRGSNLYTISVEDMIKSSLICLLSKASKNKSWLWQSTVEHLNLREEQKKAYPITQRMKTQLEVLNTLYMDLCGPMRVQTINGKKYIFVIVDDYSRFTWVKFLKSKDETPEVVIKFLKKIQIGLNKTVKYIYCDNGTELVNQVLSEYYECVSIFHQKSVPMSLQQNAVVKRQNRTLVEAARIM